MLAWLCDSARAMMGAVVPFASVCLACDLSSAVMAALVLFACNRMAAAALFTYVDAACDLPCAVMAALVHATAWPLQRCSHMLALLVICPAA